MRCLCSYGHLVVDQTDDLPYKARVSRDKLEWQGQEAFAQAAAAYLDACLKGQRDLWLQQRYGEVISLTDEQVFLDLLSHVDEHHLSLYQCPKCGHLWLQNRHNLASFLEFVPEHDKTDALNVD